MAGREQRVLAAGISRGGPEGEVSPFAAADATAFALAARNAVATGSAPGSQTGILSNAVSRPEILAEPTAAELQAACGALAAGDNDLLILLIGPPASDDSPAIIAADGIAVPLATLQPLWNGPAKQVVLLLDLHRGKPKSRPTFGELITLFPPRPGRVLAVADEGSQGSQVSGEMQAGIWAAHLSLAYGGTVARARDDSGQLTVGSLRSYLTEELPRSLARAYTDGRTQTPILMALSDAEVLADPPPVTAAPATTLKSPLARARFVTEQAVPVKSLGGYRKTLHSPPADSLATSQAFVIRLAEPDLAKELEETTGRLRQEFGYKRRDLRADGPTDGAASILTPDFSYHLTAVQHPARPDQALFSRVLTEVTEAEWLARPEVTRAFPVGFHSLHCSFDTPADVTAIIDAIEDAEPPAVVRLNYPVDLSHVEIELARFEGRVRITSGGLIVLAAGPVAPIDLLRQFMLVKDLLRGFGI